MPGVHATPEKLRAFAGQMQGYLKKLETETNALQSAFRELKGTWNDSQSAAFERELQSLMQAQGSFRESAGKKVPHLHALAQILEEYQRM